jgi:hypothetical protein
MFYSEGTIVSMANIKLYIVIIFANVFLQTTLFTELWHLMIYISCYSSTQYALYSPVELLKLCTELTCIAIFSILQVLIFVTDMDATVTIL